MHFWKNRNRTRNLLFENQKLKTAFSKTDPSFENTSTKVNYVFTSKRKVYITNRSTDETKYISLPDMYTKKPPRLVIDIVPMALWDWGYALLL